MRLLPSLVALTVTTVSGYLIKRKIDNAPPVEFPKRVAKISEICKEAVPYITNPERNSRTFGEVITRREPKYARLLKEAQEVLGISEAADEFDAINKLRLKNRELRHKITELKRKKIEVPRDSRIPFTTTQTSINREIEALENEIDENNIQVESLKGKILEIFFEHQISLKEKELEYFLMSAEGDDLINLVTIANNMERIQHLIEKELSGDPNNVQLAKSYTGMYLVSLDAYSNAHVAAIENIRNYRNKLENIFNEAENNYKEAVKLKARSNGDNFSHIDSNIALNKKTLEIVRLYDGLLERRIGNLRASRSAINEKVQIARNTYKTLDNGSMLINLVANASNEYAMLVNFEMPELNSIYDTGMLNAFMDISEKIKEEV